MSLVNAASAAEIDVKIHEKNAIIKHLEERLLNLTKRRVLEEGVKNRKVVQRLKQDESTVRGKISRRMKEKGDLLKQKAPLAAFQKKGEHLERSYYEIQQDRTKDTVTFWLHKVNYIMYLVIVLTLVILALQEVDGWSNSNDITTTTTTTDPITSPTTTTIPVTTPVNLP